MKKVIGVLVLAMLASHGHAFNLNDVKNSIDKSDKCKKDDQACKNREHLKGVAKVAAITIAAKLIFDMVVEYRSKNISDEAVVTRQYKDEHETLPEEPIASVYTTSTLPGNVFQSGKKVVIQSDMVVVPGREQKNTLIEEQIVIFDNEDNTKELKSLTKVVNAETKRAGRYANEFSFTLPEGLPQGIYPIKTALLLNGKTAKASSNDIQLVLHVDNRGQMKMVASAF
ncbi:MAG: hypothetical protein V4660_08370 [Pseudomonadota bacterium]